jgi:hypothetical protein
MAPLLTSAALRMKRLQLASRDFSVRSNGGWPVPGPRPPENTHEVWLREKNLAWS